MLSHRTVKTFVSSFQLSQSSVVATTGTRLSTMLSLTFSKDGDLGVELHPSLEHVLGAAILSDSDVTGGDSLQGPVVAVYQVGACAPRPDLYEENIFLMDVYGDDHQRDPAS